MFDAGPAVRALQAWYNSSLGLYHWDDPDIPGIIDALNSTVMPGVKEQFEDTDRWWCSANAIGALIDYMSNTGDRGYLSVVENTFNVAQSAFGLNYDNAPHVDAAHADAAHIDAGHIDTNATHVDTNVITHADFGHVDTNAPHVDTNSPHIDTNAPHVDVAVPSKLPYTNFLNNFHDDEGWWALTWIKAYDLTRDQKYLKMAATIFQDMASGWDNVFGGGIYWAKDRKATDGSSPYKNSIANELFIAVAARLYLRGASGAPVFPGTTNASYKIWAINSADWFMSCGLIGRSQVAGSPGLIPDLINDSLSSKSDTFGENDGTTDFWTYNNGVILRAFCDVSIITGDPKYRNQAERIANSAIKYFNVGGVLSEIKVDEQNNQYSKDTCMFKGPFIRNLAALFANDHNPEYSAFITSNATILLGHANSNSQFGANWSSPQPDSVDFMRQTVAIDAINAAFKVGLASAPTSLKKTLGLVGMNPPIGLRKVVAGLTASIRDWTNSVTT